jgi:hypothetical protein
VQWAREVGQRTWPELAYLYHVPNEAKRSPATAAKLKKEGMLAGVPDLGLDVARGGYHGLRIEMKRVKGGKVSEAQEAFIAHLRAQGYRAVVCCGQDAARAEIEQYMSLAPTRIEERAQL